MIVCLEMDAWTGKDSGLGVGRYMWRLLDKFHAKLTSEISSIIAGSSKGGLSKNSPQAYAYPMIFGRVAGILDRLHAWFIAYKGGMATPDSRSFSSFIPAKNRIMLSLLPLADLYYSLIRTRILELQSPDLSNPA